MRRIHRSGDQVHLMLGHLGVTRRHRDFDALVVLDHIFGSGPGFCDRLSRLLRDDLGLVYSIGGGLSDSADILPGLFRVYAATMGGQAELVTRTVIDQLRAVHAGSIADDEIFSAREYLARSWVFDYQTVEQRAERLLDLERWGLSLDEPKHWPDALPRSRPPRSAGPADSFASGCLVPRRGRAQRLSCSRHAPSCRS